jgi:hypothetical protein
VPATPPSLTPQSIINKSLVQGDDTQWIAFQSQPSTTSGWYIDDVQVFDTPITGTGTSLRGDYFDSTDLSGPLVVSRLDPQVNFDWADGTPDGARAGDGWMVETRGPAGRCCLGAGSATKPHPLALAYFSSLT